MMLHVGRRVAIAKDFERWAEERGATTCSQNLIVYLYAHDLLDRDKTYKFADDLIEKEKK